MENLQNDTYFAEGIQMALIMEKLQESITLLPSLCQPGATQAGIRTSEALDLSDLRLLTL
jgi:hypothetical protein